MDVTLETVREAKRELESKIKKAIGEFEEKTSKYFTISSIEIDAVKLANIHNTITIHNNVDVKLENNI